MLASHAKGTGSTPVRCSIIERRLRENEERRNHEIYCQRFD